MSGISGGISGIISSGEAKAAASKSGLVQLAMQNKAMAYEQLQFEAMTEMTKPFRALELVNMGMSTMNQARLMRTIAKGPGDFDYAETEGLKGYLDEMNKAFDYEPSAGLQAAIEKATGETAKMYSSQAPGGAAQSAVARATADMTLQDAQYQQNMFQQDKLAKAEARLGDYWGAREAHTNEWLSQEVNPRLSQGQATYPITMSTAQEYMKHAESIGNAYTNKGNALASSYNMAAEGTANAMNQWASSADAGAAAVGSMLASMYGGGGTTNNIYNPPLGPPRIGS